MGTGKWKLGGREVGTIVVSTMSKILLGKLVMGETLLLTYRFLEIG